ncbi:hypothetical protein M1L60_41780 [Actinoplanes sp. TRM 88003]|uniref:Uncharacterized protein n=1 Tax=Paractinoplanes aksuensis TaxID=2939490 RepID=A0ABT1E296_9ACTN|nr:hypothetical protein [Actinoplanes aksuensis]MCO8277125.1 hypothetical protein [Actinoplanes aksuensis]
MTYSPVPELNLLKAFQDEAGYGQHSDGVGLDDYDDKSGLSAEQFAAWAGGFLA